MNYKSSTLVLALLSSAAVAQEEPRYKQLLAMDLGEMLKVDVATGTAKQLSEAPAVVSVITAEEIRAMGARTLSEAIERVPGLHISAGSNRGLETFAIRGIHTDTTPQVLVMIDGIELSEMTALPTTYGFHFPVHAVERIEIIRGPGSAVYGADAFSGVINVITTEPGSINGTSAGLSVGSFDYAEAWVNTDFSINDVDIALSVTGEKQNNDNDRTTPYGVMERSRDMANIHLNIKYGQFSSKNWYWRTHQFMGVGAGIIGNDIDRDRTINYKTQFSWDGNIAETLDASFLLSYTYANYDALFQLFPSGVWPVGDDGNILQPPFTPVTFPDGVIGHPEGTSTRLKFTSTLIYSGFDQHRLRFGFGGERSELKDVKEKKNFGPGVLDVDNLPTDLVSRTIVDVSGTPFIYTPDYKRDLWFVSIQDEWKISGNLELTSGIRYDHYSDFGSTANPRVALVWANTEALTSKLLYGTAFRAPKVAELAFVNNPTTIGNPELEAEKIETIELAFDYRPNKFLSGQLNLFLYQAEDLIQQNQFVYENSGEQDGRGIELDVSWQATDALRINSNLSYVNAELPLTGDDKEQIPGFMAFVDLQYKLQADWLLTMQNYWITDRMRRAGDLRPDVDNYVKTDLNILWHPSPSWQLRFGIKNAFNDNIVEPLPDSPLFGLGLGFPDDFPKESRAVFGTIQHNFH